MHEGMSALAAILAGIIGLAFIAVIVSSKAQTSSVISSAGTAFGGLISAAVSPVSGAGTVPSLANTSLGGLIP